MKNYTYALELTKQKVVDNHPLNETGLILRDVRLHQQLTLEEVSYQICTVSYLSRIEKGEANPKPLIQRKLYTRLSIPFHFKSDQPYYWIKTFCLALEQYNLSYLQEHLETGFSTYYYQKILQKFILELTLNHLEDTKKHYHYLLAFQDYMHLDELRLFYHYVGLYFHHQPCLSIQYFRLASQLNKKGMNRDALLSLHFAQQYFNYEHDNRGIHHLQDALQLFANGHFIKYTIDCELLLCDYYIKNQIFSKAKPLLLKLYHHLKYHDAYQQLASLLLIIGHYHVEHFHYDEAEKKYLEALQINPKLNEGFVALLELYHRSDQTQKQHQLIQLIKKRRTHTNPQLIIQSNYYDFLNESDLSENFRLFLQKEAMPAAKRSSNYKYYYKYAYSLIHYYESIGKYKYALKLYNHLNENTIQPSFIN